MCNCRKDIEAKLLTRFKSTAPCATDHSASLTGYTLVLGAAITEKGCMSIELTAKHPLKKGGVKSKTDRSQMIFTYCPFCGEKYDKE